jgi:hypothetical protein
VPLRAAAASSLAGLGPPVAAAIAKRASKQ